MGRPGLAVPLLRAPLGVLARHHRHDGRKTRVSAHPIRRALGLGLRVLLVGLVAFGLWLFVRGLDPAALLAAMGSASPLLLVAAAVVNLAHLGFRMLRLRELVRPTRLIGTGRLYRYFLALFAGNNLLPARAGEAGRPWLLPNPEGGAARTAPSPSVGGE